MMASNVIGNRNSTPEASQSSLRPPIARTSAANGQNLRASADMSPFGSSPLSGQSIRPSSEVYYTQSQRSQNLSHADDAMDKAAQQWIADIDQYETTLEEMAAATLDQDFKDELSAIEQWFKVLSEAERTAALYALLQQTTQVQTRFFVQVLQEMAKGHPMSGVLSPANFADKDSNRMSDATGKLGADRTSMGRPVSTAAKRTSGLDPSTINSMFPDAANAIAKKKAEYTQQTGNAPTSNRNSAVGDRSSLVAPTISAPNDGTKDNSNVPQPSPTPWSQRHTDRPKSSSGQPAMGQFSAPPPSAGLRSPRPPHLTAQGGEAGTPAGAEHPMISPSPYNANASWASMTNTPMVPNFNTQQPPNQADMVANATAMKLAALSTVNNRLVLDDVRKYQRRTRSNDGQGGHHGMLSSGMPPGNVVVVNENGQLVNAPQLSQAQMMALQMQQQQQQGPGRGSPRPNSPGVAMVSAGLQPGGAIGGFASPQNNGYLAAAGGLSSGMAGLDLGGGQGGPGGHPGMRHGGHEGYISDHSEMQRGRSPRGRRGNSKPPEDPTDPSLLNDIPAWLRSLRLHKYTDNLKDLEWKDLVELDDKALEDRGVNALGARRKMLKTFEQVKEAQTEGKIPPA